jgi:two-component system KDP operon response regulator KdpE
VGALDAGADDFIMKPFSTPELLARMRAALRRVPATTHSGPARIGVGRLIIDFGSRTVSLGPSTSHLTPKELELLRYLTLHPNTAIPHRELLQAVWGPDYGDQVDYLRVFIKNLRRKIEPNPETPEYITTEPWVGYRFNGEPQVL